MDSAGNKHISDGAADAGRESPFKGLDPFQIEDSNYFFGRRGDSMRLAANFLASKISIVIGRSGVGKSSLLLAGVLPALKTFEEVIYLPLREWQIDPHGEFKTALEETASQYGVSLEPGEALHDLARKISISAELPLIIVCDQFEEFFVGSNYESRQKLETELSLIVSDPMCDVHMALSLREDAMHRLEQLQARIPEIMADVIPIRGIGLAGAEEAIRKPVERFNEINGTSYIVEDAFVSELLENIPANPSAGSTDVEVELPFLQLTLQHLWQIMREKGGRGLTAALLKQSDPKKIVENHFLSAIANSKNYYKELEIILDRMVTSQGSKIAYTAPELQEFVDNALPVGLLHRKPHDITRLLENLSSGKERILRVKSDGYYEIFHDVLAVPANRWRVSRKEAAQASKRHRRALYSLTGFSLVFLYLFSQLGEVDRLKLNEISRVAEAGISDFERHEVAPGLAKTLAAISLVEKAGLDKTPRGRAILNASASAIGGTPGLQGRELALKHDDTVTCEKQSSDVSDKDTNQAVDPVYTVDFDAASGKLITGDRTGIARVWDVETGTCTCELTEHRLGPGDARGNKHILDANFAKTPGMQNIAATASYDGTARLWDVQQCKMLQQLSDPDADGATHASAVRTVTFSNDARRIVTASADDTAKVWARSYSTGGRFDLLTVLGKTPLANNPSETPAHSSTVYSAVFDPDNPLLVATGSADRTAMLWNLDEGGRLLSARRIRGHSGTIRSVSFDKEGDLITAGDDETVRYWDTDSDPVRMVRGPLFAHAFDIWAAKSGETELESGSAGLLVTGSFDRKVRLWDTDSFRMLAELAAHDDAVRDVALSPDGKWIASSASDGFARLRSVEQVNGIASRREVNVFTPRGNIADSFARIPASRNRLALHPIDPERMASGDNHAVVRMWNESEACPEHTFVGAWQEGPNPEDVEFRDDFGFKCKLPVVNWGKHCSPGAVSTIAYSPDGKYLFAGYDLGSVYILDALDGTVVSSDRKGPFCDGARTEPRGTRVRSISKIAGDEILIVRSDEFVRMNVKSGYKNPVNWDAVVSPGTASHFASANLKLPVPSVYVDASADSQRVAIALMRVDDSYKDNPQRFSDIAVLDSELTPVAFLPLPAAYSASAPEAISISKSGAFVAVNFGLDVVTWHSGPDRQTYALAGTIRNPHFRGPTTMTWIGDLGMLATGGLDEVIHIYDANSSARLRTFSLQHWETIVDLAMSADGGHLYSGADDNRILSRVVVADLENARAAACALGSRDDPAKPVELLSREDAERLANDARNRFADHWNLPFEIGEWFNPAVTPDVLSEPVECK